MPLTLITLTGFVLLLGLYARWIEPRWVVHMRHQIPLPLSKPLTIILISDLHAKPEKGAAFFRRIVSNVNAERPDLIFITGDFLDKVHAALPALEPLAALRARFGVFAVLGNHDIGDMGSPHSHPAPLTTHTYILLEKLKTMNIVCLENEHRVIETDGGALVIAGIGDIWSARDDLPKALDGIPADLPAILLSHNPDVILDPLSRRAALVCAGHTHGGQLRLPFFGPLKGVNADVGKKYSHGIFRFDSTILAVTKGLGEALFDVRFLARPEVVVLKTVASGS